MHNCVPSNHHALSGQVLVISCIILVFLSAVDLILGLHDIKKDHEEVDMDGKGTNTPLSTGRFLKKWFSIDILQ